MKDFCLNIVIDKREQLPFTFSDSDFYANSTVVQGTLNTGDYSILGLENRVAVERKSLADLVMCLGKERLRFEKELERSKALESFAVIVEATWKDLASGNYRSQLNPRAGCASIIAFMSRGTKFFFAGNRPAAEWITFSFLKFYAQDRLKELKSIEKAMGLAGSRREGAA